MTIEAISWTKEELEEWIENGLVPSDLLEPSRWKELSDFIRENSSNFPRHRTTKGEGKTSGKSGKSDEQIKTFELCKGIKLPVKAKDIPKWKSETSEAKNLSKEQHENLKAFISKYGSNRELTRQEIITFIEEVRKPKKGEKYRQSGHLIDAKLKHSKPNQQKTLFDVISPETKQKIEQSEIEVRAEGIRLTPPESKLVHALNIILHNKSQNKDSSEEDFYSGNAPSQMVPYGQNREQKASVIKFKPSELYKAYIGQSTYSGADISFINNVMHQLESKKVLIKYDRIKKVKVGGKEKTLTDRIEDFQSLIKILVFIPDLTEEDKAKLDKGDQSIRDMKGEIVIALNPIFTDQIDTKFIEFPMDTNRRLIIAAGGHKKVSASMQTLMEWMLRELSAKRYKTEINEENLPYILGLEKYVKQGRKKLLQERISKDIQAVSNLGLILKFGKKPNKTGGFKWIFHLNKDYQ